MAKGTLSNKKKNNFKLSKLFSHFKKIIACITFIVSLCVNGFFVLQARKKIVALKVFLFRNKSENTIWATELPFKSKWYYSGILVRIN